MTLEQLRIFIAVAEQAGETSLVSEFAQALTEVDGLSVVGGGDGTVHEVVNGLVDGDRPVVPDAVLGVVAFAFQIYGDFSGYTDMGRGCARMLGGRWAGVVCHTRSGAFGGPQDLLDVLGSV